jgi:hypothetical protein
VLKVTSRGVEEGSIVELSSEDLRFISDMFEDFTDYEKPLYYLRDKIDDEMYEEL